MLRKLALAVALIATLVLPTTEALAWRGGGRGGFHGGGFHRGGFHGGGYRGHYGGGRAIYRGRGAYVGRGYYGGRAVYRGGGRYWHGRYWGYGVGPCWRATPYGGWTWVCY
jgi:hypothetical protein